MGCEYGPLWRRRTRFFAVAAIFLLLALPAAQARTLKLLIFGDSLVAGYGLAPPDAFQAQLLARLRADGLDLRLLDGGVSGDTSAGGRARLDWVLADQPDAALVEFGGNDGLRGISPADMATNLAAILDTLAARHIPTLLSGMYAPPNLGASYGREFRAVFDRLGQRPGLLYDPFFLAGVAGDPALNQADRMHPNPAGVQREVARIAPLLERLLQEVKQ